MESWWRRGVFLNKSWPTLTVGILVAFGTSTCNSEKHVHGIEVVLMAGLKTCAFERPNWPYLGYNST